MIVLGLTGSMAMGKSETARMFAGEGIPVFDSDAEVHRQYGSGGQAAALIAHRWPQAMTDGSVDRQKLSALILDDPAILAEVEVLVHPIIAREQQRFINHHRKAGTAIVLLDIPLLFETGREDDVDRTIVVSAPQDIQRQRALARPGMTESKLATILRRQWTDERKRARADFVVDTSQGLEHARLQVREIIQMLLKEQD
jgi:dephospho-CoA kinase